jgi:hypothetical protein
MCTRWGRLKRAPFFRRPQQDHHPDRKSACDDELGQAPTQNASAPSSESKLELRTVKTELKATSTTAALRSPAVTLHPNARAIISVSSISEMMVELRRESGFSTQPNARGGARDRQCRRRRRGLRALSAARNQSGLGQDADIRLRAIRRRLVRIAVQFWPSLRCAPESVADRVSSANRILNAPFSATINLSLSRRVVNRTSVW